MSLNLRDAKNWDAIVAMVAAAAREAKPGEWIVGRGWHQEKWDTKPSPKEARQDGARDRVISATGH